MREPRRTSLYKLRNYLLNNKYTISTNSLPYNYIQLESFEKKFKYTFHFREDSDGHITTLLISKEVNGVYGFNELHASNIYDTYIIKNIFDYIGNNLEDFSLRDYIKKSKINKPLIHSKKFIPVPAEIRDSIQFKRWELTIGI